MERTRLYLTLSLPLRQCISTWTPWRRSRLSFGGCFRACCLSAFTFNKKQNIASPIHACKLQPKTNQSDHASGHHSSVYLLNPRAQAAHPKQINLTLSLAATHPSICFAHLTPPATMWRADASDQRSRRRRIGRSDRRNGDWHRSCGASPRPVDVTVIIHWRCMPKHNCKTPCKTPSLTSENPTNNVSASPS